MIFTMKNKRLLVGVHAVVLLSVALPILNLMASLGRYPLALMNHKMVVDALSVSLSSALITLAVVICLGTPVAYLNARLNYPGKKVFETLLDLPMVLPPAVAGLALLMTFGKSGFFGQRGIQIPFTLAAVILAQLFVAMPLYIKTVTEGFKKVPTSLENTAMTLGDSRIRAVVRISLPLAGSSILTAAMMSWARALAEFGATMMFAGNMQGITQTLPLAIYTAMEQDMATAVNMARVMVLAALSILVAVHWVSRRQPC